MSNSLVRSLVLVVLVGTVLSQEVCRDGDTKMTDCNACKCLKSKWMCTKKFCTRTKRAPDIPVSADLKNTPCAPNDYFILDCNRCYCNIQRTGYVCTEKLCPVTTSTTKPLISRLLDGSIKIKNAAEENEDENGQPAESLGNGNNNQNIPTETQNTERTAAKLENGNNHHHRERRHTNKRIFR